MKILVGIDDSESSQEALRAVTAQIRPQNTEVRILHVLQPISVSTPPEMARDFTPELDEQNKTAQELVDKAARKMASAGFKVDSVIDKGDVRETIIDLAVQWHADLIVIGSHGSAGLRRFLLGSVAESLTHYAPCSVEIVRMPARVDSSPVAGKRSLEAGLKILLAIDDSKFSEAAMEMAIRQMRLGGAEVCVLHVVLPVLLSPVYGGTEAVAKEEHRRRAWGEKLVSRYKQLFAEKGFNVTTAVKQDDPRPGIIDYAAQWKADLIIVGSHGLIGLDRLLCGSVADSVARHAV